MAARNAKMFAGDRFVNRWSHSTLTPRATPSTIRQVWVPDYGQDLGAGELVLLTSDGVHDAVPHDELVALIREQRDPQALAEVIVAAAREDDGYRDDATVIVLARRC